MKPGFYLCCKPCCGFSILLGFLCITRHTHNKNLEHSIEKKISAESPLHFSINFFPPVRRHKKEDTKNKIDLHVFLYTYFIVYCVVTSSKSQSVMHQNTDVSTRNKPCLHTSKRMAHYAIPINIYKHNMLQWAHQWTQTETNRQHYKHKTQQSTHTSTHVNLEYTDITVHIKNSSQ